MVVIPFFAFQPNHAIMEIPFPFHMKTNIVVMKICFGALPLRNAFAPSWQKHYQGATPRNILVCIIML